MERELLLDLPVFVALAMIGPRRFSRGKDRHEMRRPTVITSLQSGHGVSAVESRHEELGTIEAIELQWGHGVSAVESGGRP